MVLFLFVTWEQRKLWEIANIQKGQQLGKAEMRSAGTYYVLNGGMEASGFTNQYNTPANTISISEGGNSCGYVSLNLERFWSGGHNYTLQNLKIDTIFLYQWLKRHEKEIMALRVGSGLPNIQKSSLQDVEVAYSTTAEQQAIATFLIKIDNLKTWDYKGKGGFLPTKNKTSVRKIQIDWQTVVQFSELIKDKPEDEPLFVGCKVYNSTVNDVLRRRCKLAGIPTISVHGLRHTHASLLLFAGVSIASVARRLGHASINTTQKTYLHIIQELENKDIDLVMRALSSL